jgi:hypothetical protein
MELPGLGEAPPEPGFRIILPSDVTPLNSLAEGSINSIGDDVVGEGHGQRFLLLFPATPKTSGRKTRTLRCSSADLGS